MDDFFGWGPVSEGTGPDVKMIVFYHLNERGRVVHLEPGATKLLSKAQATNITVGGSAAAGSGSSFRTKDDVRSYIGFFSGNDFGKASGFWAPDLEVRLGKSQVIQGREENVRFFSEQRRAGMDENVAPKQITLDDSCCVLHAEVTFTARKDFPEVRMHYHVEAHCLCANVCGRNVACSFFFFFFLSAIPSKSPSQHTSLYTLLTLHATGVCGNWHDIRRNQDWPADLDRDDDFVRSER